MLHNNPQSSDQPETVDTTAAAPQPSAEPGSIPNPATDEIGSPLARESEMGSEDEEAVTDDGDEDFEDVDTEPDHDGHHRGSRSNLATWALALHPYVQSLTLSDIESCVTLENAVFPPEQRCAPEKFRYRLTKAGNICLGLFTSSIPTTSESANPPLTLNTARPVDSFHPARTSVLIGHVIATKTFNETVHNEDMGMPENWETASTCKAPSSLAQNGTAPGPGPDHAGIPAADASGASGTDPAAAEDQAKIIGHQEHGRTVAIHSLAILPQYQRGGLGEMLLDAYCQRIEGSGVAERISLLTYDRLVKFYTSHGFHDCGPSKSNFAGEAWHDLVRPLRPQNEDSEDEMEDEEDDHMFEIDDDDHVGHAHHMYHGHGGMGSRSADMFPGIGGSLI